MLDSLSPPTLLFSPSDFPPPPSLRPGRDKRPVDSGGHIYKWNIVKATLDLSRNNFSARIARSYLRMFAEDFPSSIPGESQTEIASLYYFNYLGSLGIMIRKATALLEFHPYIGKEKEAG